MSNPIITTVSRDFSLLLSRRSFWWLWAAWALIAAIIYFAYLTDFLTIQATLRAKNFRYGVTDLVIIPYLKTLGTLAIVLMASLCARGFYYERFASFSLLYRSTPQHPLLFILAKWLTAALFATGILVTLALPVISSYVFFDYNIARVLITILALFMLLWMVGIVAMLLSLLFNQSILVALLTLSWVAFGELMTRLIVEPAWITPIIAFFSPLAHIHRITLGLLAGSDILFFLLLAALLTLLALRQYQNTYLSTN